jgi:hypothetical protein
MHARGADGTAGRRTHARPRDRRHGRQDDSRTHAGRTARPAGTPTHGQAPDGPSVRKTRASVPVPPCRCRDGQTMPGRLTSRLSGIVVAEEGVPGLSSAGSISAPDHVTPDRAGRMVDPEPGIELLGGLVLARLRMVARNALSEGHVLSGDLWSSDLAPSRPPTPEHLEALMVPESPERRERAADSQGRSEPSTARASRRPRRATNRSPSS